MRFSAIALAAAVPAFVSAATQMVNVGMNGTLSFIPSSVTAVVGDTVQFMFSSKNHSVVQSTFTDPCTISNVNNTQGFTSGYKPVPADSTQFPVFEIGVNQTGPIWFYCGQTIPVNHCNSGMVGVINPTADKTFDMFQAAAKALNSSASNPTGTTSGPAPTKSNGAMRVSGGAAGLLTLVGLVAGVAL